MATPKMVGVHMQVFGVLGVAMFSEAWSVQVDVTNTSAFAMRLDEMDCGYRY